MSWHPPRRGHPQFAALVGRKVQRHHAENRVRLAIEANAPADNRAIRRKIALPYSVSKHHNMIIAGLSITRFEAASEDWTDSEQRKKAWSRHRACNTFRTISRG